MKIRTNRTSLTILTLLFLLECCFLISCSNGNDLSKEEAEKQILENIEKKITMHIKMGEIDPRSGQKVGLLLSYSNDPQHPLDEFSNPNSPFHGLYLLKQYDMIQTEKTGKNRYLLRKTMKSEPFFVKQYIYKTYGPDMLISVFVVAELKNIEITGITEPAESNGLLVRQVSFKKHFSLNPFAQVHAQGFKFHEFSGSEYRDLKESTDGSVTFVKFEDGWRIQL